MRRFISACLALAFAFTPPSVTASRLAPPDLPVQYTTSPVAEIPSAAVGVTVTPSGSSWGNSAYAQVTASTSSAWLLVGAAVVPGSAETREFELDVATGASSSEAVVGTLPGSWGQSSGANRTPLYFPVPIDNVGSGDRVSVRLRKSGTNTTAWTVSLMYLAKPVTGYVVTTSSAAKVEPSATDSLSITGSAVAWNNSAWVQLVSSTATDWSVGGIAWCCSSQVDSVEVDIGTGGSGSEAVVATVASGAQTLNTNQSMPINPLVVIPSGSRVALRFRHSFASAFTQKFKVLYYPTTVSSDVTTGGVQQLTPGSGGTSVVAGGSAWANAASWTQFVSSTSSNISIVGLRPSTTSGSSIEFDVGVGASSSESAVTTFRMRIGGSALGSNFVALPMKTAIASGSRVSGRVRASTGSLNISYSLIYIDSSVCSQCGAFRQAVWPSAANDPTVAGAGTAYASSSWVELTSAAAVDSLITGFEVQAGAFVDDTAYDIGTGGSGSEAVLTTVRVSSVSSSSVNYIPLPVPTFVAAGTRVAMRFRKTGTSTSTWGFAVTYVSMPVAIVPVPYFLSRLVAPPWKKAA